MQLYNTNNSPYCSRVRIQIYHKSIPVEVAAPPAALGSDEYRAKVPLGKVPALAINGRILGESLVIMEYLEDKFPEPPMRPQDVDDLAKMREIAHANDNYLMPAVRDLFMAFRAGAEDEDAVKNADSNLKGQLARIQSIFGEGRFAIGNSLTLADCALVPAVHYAAGLAGMLKLHAPLADLPRVNGWWESVTSEPAVAKVRDEIDAALRAMQQDD